MGYYNQAALVSASNVWAAPASQAAPQLSFVGNIPTAFNTADFTLANVVMFQNVRAISLATGSMRFLDVNFTSCYSQVCRDYSVCTAEFCVAHRRPRSLAV